MCDRWEDVVRLHSGCPPPHFSNAVEEWKTRKILHDEIEKLHTLIPLTDQNSGVDLYQIMQFIFPYDPLWDYSNPRNLPTEDNFPLHPDKTSDH